MQVLLHSLLQPSIKPPLTHASAGGFLTLLGKSGSVSFGVTAPFSWVLVHTRFCLCPPRVYFPILCKFYVGVNDNLLQENLRHTQVSCTQSPCPCARPLLTHTSAGDTQTVLSQSLWGPWVLVCTRMFKRKLYKCTNLGLVHLIRVSKRWWFNMFDFQGRISI